jgi:hypothetical protein
MYWRWNVEENEEKNFALGWNNTGYRIDCGNGD